MSLQASLSWSFSKLRRSCSPSKNSTRPGSSPIWPRSLVVSRTWSWGHPSLFDYCTQRLGLDEGAAYLRMQVAGCCRRFPQILDALANNELSLTVAGRIAPHLTRDNVEELLAQSKGKSKRQVKELLVSLQPRPVVSSGMKKQAPPQPAPVKEESRSAPGLMPLEPSETPTVPEPSGTGRGSIEPARRHVYNIRFSAEEAFKKKFERLAEVLGVHNPHRQMATLLEKALDIALEKKDPQQRLERRERRARAQKSSPRPAKERAGHRIPSEEDFLLVERA